MTLAETLILVGRIALGLFFIIAAIRNFMRFSARIASDTNYGWKLPPAVIALGFVTQLVGGLSVTLGILPVYGAIALIIFLICATALYHNFTLFKGEERSPHLYFTLVNCALVGHCLMVIGTSL